MPLPLPIMNGDTVRDRDKVHQVDAAVDPDDMIHVDRVQLKERRDQKPAFGKLDRRKRQDATVSIVLNGSRNVEWRAVGTKSFVERMCQRAAKPQDGLDCVEGQESDNPCIQ